MNIFEISVPKECPGPLEQLDLVGTHKMVGIHFPRVPGVPSSLKDERTLFGAATQKAGQRGQLSQVEWEAWLRSAGTEIGRGVYHLARFREVLEITKRRRDVAGGPVFMDFEPAKAIYCEAAGYISTTRTFVDQVVDVAARRLGQTKGGVGAVHQAIMNSTVPAKYAASGEILALRNHATWFEKLNAYRNAINHSGWHSESFGYFSKDDIAPESDSWFNVMRMPDLACLVQKAPPHQWTFQDRTWLDELVDEIDAGLQAIFQDLLTVWGITKSPEGTIPREKQANTYLQVPMGVPCKFNQDPTSLQIFLSEEAATKFIAKHQMPGVTVRAVRPTKLPGATDDMFLIAFNEPLMESPSEVQVVTYSQGSFDVAGRMRFDPGNHDGLFPNILNLVVKEGWQEAVYVLTMAPRV